MSFAVLLNKPPKINKNIDFKEYYEQISQNTKIFWEYYNSNNKNLLKTKNLDIPFINSKYLSPLLLKKKNTKQQILQQIRPEILVYFPNSRISFNNTNNYWNIFDRYLDNSNGINLIIGYPPNSKGGELIVFLSNDNDNEEENTQKNITIKKKSNNEWTWWYIFISNKDKYYLNEIHNHYILIYKSISILPNKYIESFECQFNNKKYETGDNVEPNSRNYCNKCKCDVTGYVVCSEEYCPTKINITNDLSTWKYGSPPEPIYDNPNIKEYSWN